MESPSPAHDLETPLLRPQGSGCEDEEHQQTPHNTFSCYTNLTKAILGAGIMAMPKALALTGTGLGATLLLLVGVLTWYSATGLVHGSQRNCARSYGSLTHNLLGTGVSRVLQLALIATCLGFLVVYVDIILDSLVGAGNCEGILAQALPFGWSSTVWTSRSVVLALLMLLVVAPNVLRRSMAHLSFINSVGLLSLLGFAASMVWVAVAATLNGVGHPLPFGPDLKSLGHGTLHQLIRAGSLVPIILTSDGCHQAVHPVMALLKPYNSRSMSVIIALAVGTATALYAIVSASAYIAFGPLVEEDVLNNLDVPTLEKLIGTDGAAAVAFGVRLGCIVSLLGNTILMLFPLREACAEVLLGRQSHDQKHFAFKRILTIGLLFTVYCLAILVPSMWDIIAVIGSFSSTIVCFIVPGAIIFTIQDGAAWSHTLGRSMGLIVAGLGGLLLANGVATSVIGINAKA